MSTYSCVTLLGKMETLNILRSEGTPATWTNGYQNTVPTINITIQANVQPTMESGVTRTLSRRRVSERTTDRKTDGIVIYSKSIMFTGDIISRQNKKYEVYQVDDWTPYKCLGAINYRAIAYMVETYP
jgi:hypothetical protein